MERKADRLAGRAVPMGYHSRREFRTSPQANASAERYGLDAAQAEYLKSFAGDLSNKRNVPLLRNRIQGNIAYIGQIRGRDDAVYRRLLAKFHVLIGDPLPEVSAAMSDNARMRDVFICHASEDKSLVVEPLVSALQAAGMSVWFDKAEIRWGDSLTGKINEGLKESRYVLVVLSQAFLAKKWPHKELNAALGREIIAGKTSVLPLMVGTPTEVAAIQATLPLQADKLFLSWSDGPGKIVAALQGLLAPPAE